MLVHWFLVSKPQDDCFRSRHCNHVQDQKIVEGVRPAASGPSYLRKETALPQTVLSRIPLVSLARTLSEGCPFLLGRLEHWLCSFSILYGRGKQGWRDLEKGTESAQPGFCPNKSSYQTHKITSRRSCQELLLPHQRVTMKWSKHCQQRENASANEWIIFNYMFANKIES